MFIDITYRRRPEFNYTRMIVEGSVEQVEGVVAWCSENLNRDWDVSYENKDRTFIQITTTDDNNSMLIKLAWS